MALLIHIDYGSGRTFGHIHTDVGRVVHGEVVADIHTTIGGDMAFEAAVRHHNAAEHGCGGVILGGQDLGGIRRETPLMIIPVKCLPALDSELGGFGEVPHNLLRGIAVCIPHRISHMTIAGVGRHITVGDFLTIPPETPTVIERNRVRTRDVDNHRRRIGDVCKSEGDATVTFGIQHGGINVEHFKRRIVRTGEGNQLFLLLVRAGIAFNEVEIILRVLVYTRLVGIHITVVVTGIRSSRRGASSNRSGRVDLQEFVGHILDFFCEELRIILGFTVDANVAQRDIVAVSNVSAGSLFVFARIINGTRIVRSGGGVSGIFTCFRTVVVGDAGVTLNFGLILVSRIGVYEATRGVAVCPATEGGHILRAAIEVILHRQVVVASHDQHITTGFRTILATETNHAKAETPAVPALLRGVDRKLAIDKRQAFGLHGI